MTQRKHRPIQAVLFDFDGTLTIPDALDFPAIRSELGCPAGRPILEFIQSIEDRPRRQRLMDRLAGLETSAACRSRPGPGAEQLVHWLKSRGLALGILTRNSRSSVLRALENFDQIGQSDFDLIITRDDPIRPKPSGQGVVLMAQRLHLHPVQILVVGDFVFDCQAARAAGSPAALLDALNDPRLESVDCDYRIGGLTELKDIVMSLDR